MAEKIIIINNIIKVVSSRIINMLGKMLSNFDHFYILSSNAAMIDFAFYPFRG